MFSQIVDTVVRRTQRPDALLDIVDHTNSTIRELHSLQYFAGDLVFVQLTATGQITPWEVPTYFRAIQSVSFDATMFVSNIQPSAKIIGRPRYYYRGGNAFAFVGAESFIDLFYYEHPRVFYYATADNVVAKFDVENAKWLYKSGNAYVDHLATSDLEQEARDKVTTWLVSSFPYLVTQGAIAKLYQSKDDSRAKAEYSLYKDQQREVIASQTNLLHRV